MGGGHHAVIVLGTRRPVKGGVLSSEQALPLWGLGGEFIGRKVVGQVSIPAPRWRVRNPPYRSTTIKWGLAAPHKPYSLGYIIQGGMTMAVQEQFETDVLQTSAGDLKITFLGHGTLMLTFKGRNIHVDPFSRVADYAKLPKADVIVITHEHRDHLDLQALASVRTEKTEVVLTEACAKQVEGGIVMQNGDVHTVNGVTVEAVPAYNLVHKRENGEPFHPKGVGNGYVMTFGDKRVYIAGDTENIPEMNTLQDIDCAFLPMNLPYTMTPEMVADAAKAFQPKILYPYHYGNTDPSKLVELLREQKGIEVRIRKME
jgi:L-ascorbate metabolism protein UlaG (beta-lactamase superfamily)